MSRDPEHPVEDLAGLLALMQHTADLTARLLDGAVSEHDRVHLRGLLTRVDAGIAAHAAAPVNILETGLCDFRSAFRHAPIGMAITTPSGYILEANSALVSVLGISGDALPGMLPFDVVHSDYHRLVEETRRSLVSGQNDTATLELVLRVREGKELFVRVFAARITGNTLHPERLIMLVEDISEHRDTLKGLEYQALHDPLTGLFNRTVFLNRLENAVARLARHEAPLTVLFLDLDAFKSVNDKYGHGVGDELLVTIAERLTTELRPGDTIARIGGDEFVVLCEDTGAEAAEPIVARIISSLEQTVMTTHHHLRLTVSVGAATATADFSGVYTDLLRSADSAMYEMKGRRRRFPT